MSDQLIYENVRIWLGSLEYKLPPPINVLAEMQVQNYTMIKGDRPGDERPIYVFITNSPVFVSTQPNFKKLWAKVAEPNARMFIVSTHSFKFGIVNFITAEAGDREVRCIERKIFKVDIREQRGVPLQFICSDEEASAVLTENKQRPEGIPSISTEDAYVIWLDARPGQIIRSERAQGAPYYRIVRGVMGFGADAADADVADAADADEDAA